eukprot:m.73235 g.73235  ORF g.73235 m.73235 type:complete len:140 (+) comp35831_c0_seq1:612-1031(+)
MEIRLKRDKMASSQELNFLQAELEKKVSTMDDLKAVQQELRQLVEDKESSLKEKQAHIDCLEKENERLSSKITAREKHFHDQAAAVSKDEQVILLKERMAATEAELEGLKREYNAYKKHCSQLLTKERELNSRLRHLLK